MHMKSFLAGGAAVAILASVVVAEQITVPNQFTAGTPARASEVNANFDALVQESNSQDLRIEALKGDVDKIGNVEQLFCSIDVRNGSLTMNDLGDTVAGFPLPSIRYRNDDSLGSITESPAICLSLLEPGDLIESDARQLAWMGGN